MIDPDHYYEEFLRYHDLAETQQRECNLGTIPHTEGSVTDPLMQHVELYDVVARKYAGFTQLMLDLWYNTSEDHPYAEKLHERRAPICQAFEGVELMWGIEEWLYIFLLHRLTGSGINYAKKPSGYNNTIIPYLHGCDDLDQLVKKTNDILQTDTKAYTSVGYQFPRFPPKLDYKRGGDRFMFEYAPRLARDLAEFLTKSSRKLFLREVGEWMFQWNKDNGLSAYKFQYAAVVSDIADFFPEYVDRQSMFFYGSNAVECISYMTGGKKSEKALDAVMERAMNDTGNVPYNLEDVACDFIRYVENYVKPGADYDHVNRDTVWNTSNIAYHPFGRQYAMLEHGLIGSFNDLTEHPSDDYVLKQAGMTKEEYWEKILLT